MRVIVERNAHIGTRTAGSPELVFLDVAAKLVTDQGRTAYLPHAANLGTALGRDLLEAVDMIPGIELAKAQRYRLIVAISKMFDADAVVAEVLQAIECVTGESVEQA